MNSLIDKNYKIKKISFIFESRPSDKLYDKIMKIINNNKIEYTENKNGIFLNLNSLDDDILDIIYKMSNYYEKELNNFDKNNNNVNNYKCKNKDNYCETFIKQKNNIKYFDIDYYILNLSKINITI